MKIELNYTYDELITLLDGLNNALISLKRNYSAMSFGLYNGVPDSSGTCNNTGTAQQIGTKAFNSSFNDAPSSNSIF